MSLEEIGQKLKLARDDSGLSLSQIHEKTKIPFSHLSAIDAGNFDDLPEPVYVSGFIKRYAECVGLDGQELADQYRSQLESLIEPQKKGFGSKRHKNNGHNMPPQSYYNRPPIEQSPPNLIKLIPFYALWIVLILGLIIYLVNRQGTIDLSQQDSALLTLKQSTASINNQKTLPPAELPENAAVQPAETNASEQENLSDNNASHIILKAKNHVWVEVKAVSSGEALFNGFMEAGDSHDFSDKEGFRVRAGNGGNLLVTSDGKTEAFGTLGKITEKTIATSKSHQVAENPTETNSDQSTTTTQANSQPTVSHKKPAADTTTASPKKPVETTAPAKKPAIANKPKLRPLSENPYSAGGNSETNSNSKSIDVPYRYSE